MRASSLLRSSKMRGVIAARGMNQPALKKTAGR